MSTGVYSTLMAMLSAAPSLSGVSLTFGEENINAQEQPLPWCNVVPTSGAFVQPGYSLAANVNANTAGWMSHESVDLYCWAFDLALDNPEAHADETLDLVEKVLQAFQQQTRTENPANSEKGGGLMFRPTAGRWQLMQGQNVRYGRAYVITCGIDISFTDALPVDATILTITKNPTIVTG